MISRSRSRSSSLHSFSRNVTLELWLWKSKDFSLLVPILAPAGGSHRDRVLVFPV
jgi:hypothetical protein